MVSCVPGMWSHGGNQKARHVPGKAGVRGRSPGRPLLGAWSPLPLPRLPSQPSPQSQAGGGELTVSRQVEDQVDHEGDEHAGHQDVDDVEEWLAADDEVEGNVLALGAVQRGAGVHVDPGRPVHYLPLAILCGQQMDSMRSGQQARGAPGGKGGAVGQIGGTLGLCAGLRAAASCLWLEVFTSSVASFVCFYFLLLE